MINKEGEGLVIFTLNMLATNIHSDNVKVGWYRNPTTGRKLKERNVMEMLMLIVTEIAEAAEGYRKNLMDDKLPDRKMVEVELADTLIRIFDLAGYQELDLGGAVIEKLKYNASRADHKIENRRKPGGKIC